MAKKHKGVVKSSKKASKKALRSVKRHGTLSAALVAIGGFASSILANDKFRQAVQDLLSRVVARASQALDEMASRKSDVLARLSDSSEEREEHDSEDREHEREHAHS